MVIELIGTELRFPNGAAMPNIPKLAFSALVFSPDCGFLLESGGPRKEDTQESVHLQGEKIEAYLRRSNRHVIMLASIYCLQIWTLMRQMKDASTPAALSRISVYTIATMGLGDGFMCMGLTLGAFDHVGFLVLISAAFLAAMSVSFFGMTFLVDIWSVQAPERRARQRQIHSTSSAHQNNGNAGLLTVTAPATASQLRPPPVTASIITSSGATPIILPPDQDLDAAEAEDAQMASVPANTNTGTTRQETAALYTRFYMALLALVFVFLQSAFWSTGTRSACTRGLISIYLSFWIPQIHSNLIRNFRKALRWEFVVSQSLLRLAPVIYLYTSEDNLLLIGPDRRAALFFAGWVWIQIWILFGQEVLGPRFFLPEGWVSPAYDYHPILREEDLESGVKMPLGFSHATKDVRASASLTGGKASSKDRRIFDCAICMQNIEVPIVPSGSTETETSSSGLSSVFSSRRAYMVTPCRHIFHTSCLEGWMSYRLQCPICRDPLVPI